MEWYIGCSGFYYKEWKNIFYPKGLPESKWFEYYCQHFNTLELNVTFYRFPSLQLLQGWHRRSPGQFLFTAKVPRLITHQKQFKEAHEELSSFYKLLRFGLKEKLGCVLFQLPPQFRYSGERLEQIINHLDLSFTNVIEFRHASWWREEVLEQLQEYKIVFCGVSYPALPNEPVAVQPAAYYRFHGVPHLYHSPYEKTFMEKIVREVKAADVPAAYLYFNNTASGAALKNAEEVKEMV